MSLVHNIRCAVCGTSVERWSQRYDPYLNAYVFVAECHGEVDECIIDYTEVLGPLTVVDAVAFQTGRRHLI